MNPGTPPAARLKLLLHTFWLSLLTLASRVLGFVREMVIAVMFGAGAAADAFLIAFRIPNLLRQLLADGALNPALVPALTAAGHPDPAGQRLLSERLLGSFLFWSLLLLVLGLLLAPALVALTAPGFVSDPRRFALSTDLLRLTLPYLVFAALAAVLLAMLLAQARFVLAASTTMLPNLAMIVVALLAASQFTEPVTALALGLLLGGILQLALPLLVLWRQGWWPRPRLAWSDPQQRQVWRSLLPALLSGSALHVNVLLGGLIASFLQVGSVSWLYLSDRLLQFPQGMFGVALAAIVLQQLSAAHVTRDQSRTDHTLAWGLRLAWIIALPAGLSLLLLAEPLVWTIYGYGRFTAVDVQMCSLALIALAPGLPAFLLGKVLAASQHARMQMRQSLHAAGWSVLANGLLAVLAVGWLHQQQHPAPHLGIAAAASAACWLQWWLLRRGVPATSDRDDWHQPGLKLMIAAGVLIATLLWLTPLAGDWQSLGGGQRLLRVCALLAAAGIAYVATLALLGLRPRHLQP